MDRRDAMAQSGSSGSYYIQRGMPSPAFQHVSSQIMQFQSNMGGVCPMDALELEPISTSSIHSVDQSSQLIVQPKKRGRPRKYGPDRGVSLGLTTSHSIPRVTNTSSSSEQKRGRGRPPGSVNKLQVATLAGSVSGLGFTPHVITIAVGEDVTAKIMSFSLEGPRTVCILSANGSVSTATLAQPSTSGGTLTYEGQFGIISLSGSYTAADGSRNRSGGLSISLASPDGRVIGGRVGGLLIAESPVQVIVGSFLCAKPKTKNKISSLEAEEDTKDSERHGIEYSVTPRSVHSTPSPVPISSMGGWPHIRSVGMRDDGHADIDLMRE